MVAEQRSASGGAGTSDGRAGRTEEVAALRELVAELQKERDMLADDVQVKTQMAVSLANAFHTTKKALTEARAASSNKDAQLVTNVSEVSSLRSQLQQQTQRAAAAERRCSEAEAELQAAKHAAADAEARVTNASSLQGEVQRLQEALEEKNRDMDSWKVNMREWIAGKNSETKQLSEKLINAEAEHRRATAKLQEEVTRLKYEIETAKSRGAKQPDTQDAAVQVKLVATPPQSPVAPTARAATPPPVPVAEATHTPEGQGPRDDTAPWASPPPIKPEATAEPLPPMIVTVHYGSSDGWTVDTKLLAKPGMTVADVIAEACERVNSRYGRNLDCAGMCLKTHHTKAKRPVVLSEHREMHSFTYFRKCQSSNKPIILQLEAVPANVLFASPNGRASGRMSMSRARPSM